MAQKIATREAYGNALAEFGGDPRIVVLDSDLSKSTKTDTFKKVFPERFVNMGIAEGNMMSVAAGLATTGKVVFASSFAMFAALRACEQVRNSICYPKLNVKIGASHAGLTVGEDGASHQSVEDIAIMRAIPNMIVINPSDATTMRAAVKAAIEIDGPVYLRLGRLPVDVLYEEDVPFQVGKGIQIKEGNDVTIIATGMMVGIALAAVETLTAEGVHARLIDMHTIKPIDQEIILKAAKETGAIVTVEEHNVLGGLGGAVTEVVADLFPVPVKRVGIQDVFGKSGKPMLLLEKYGLTSATIVKAAKSAIAMKK
ncbi:MAG: transketolase family protein [Clostridia bacterium]